MEPSLHVLDDASLDTMELPNSESLDRLDDYDGDDDDDSMDTTEPPISYYDSLVILDDGLRFLATLGKCFPDRMEYWEQRFSKPPLSAYSSAVVPNDFNNLYSVRWAVSYACRGRPQSPKWRYWQVDVQQFCPWSLVRGVLTAPICCRLPCSTPPPPSPSPENYELIRPKFLTPSVAKCYHDEFSAAGAGPSILPPPDAPLVQEAHLVRKCQPSRPEPEVSQDPRPSFPEPAALSTTLTSSPVCSACAIMRSIVGTLGCEFPGWGHSCRPCDDLGLDGCTFLISPDAARYIDTPTVHSRHLSNTLSKLYWVFNRVEAASRLAVHLADTLRDSTQELEDEAESFSTLFHQLDITSLDVQGVVDPRELTMHDVDKSELQLLKFIRKLASLQRNVLDLNLSP
ncbi:hypothetical protein M413DRAFT_32771 [Hebeloma cylindrosporum]|uniref:Uncharacterized protein n=1 Tax=Hebeloma cylindrosporum TaxID=76867 RepID=A0A0C3BEB2_HEBCY|nr:hypothetical protein M413DRAFT_32771 [Hebeloma cylindrosporum h7]